MNPCMKTEQHKKNHKYSSRDRFKEKHSSKTFFFFLFKRVLRDFYIVSLKTDNESCLPLHLRHNYLSMRAKLQILK